MSKLSELCGKRVALLLGGYWGSMRIVVDEALRRGMHVVILPPLEREHVEYPEQALVLRMGVSYRVRSVFLVRSCDVLVALGGGSGTMQEVFTAYCEAKPVLILRTGLDSDKLEKLGPYLDSRALTKVELLDDPEELAKRVSEILGCSR